MRGGSSKAIAPPAECSVPGIPKKGKAEREGGGQEKIRVEEFGETEREREVLWLHMEKEKRERAY